MLHPRRTALRQRRVDGFCGLHIGERGGTPAFHCEGANSVFAQDDFRYVLEARFLRSDSRRPGELIALRVGRTAHVSIERVNRPLGFEVQRIPRMIFVVQLGLVLMGTNRLVERLPSARSSDAVHFQMMFVLESLDSVAGVWAVVSIGLQSPAMNTGVAKGLQVVLQGARRLRTAAVFRCHPALWGSLVAQLFTPRFGRVVAGLQAVVAAVDIGARSGDVGLMAFGTTRVSQ